MEGNPEQICPKDAKAYFSLDSKNNKSESNTLSSQDAQLFSGLDMRQTDLNPFGIVKNEFSNKDQPMHSLVDPQHRDRYTR